MIITKKGLWTTLRNTANEGELAIRSKCDICLILIGNGNTGYGEVISVMPTKNPSMACLKRTHKAVYTSVQELSTPKSTRTSRVTTNHHAKPKPRHITQSVNFKNILTENGKSNNTRSSNGTRTRHTTRALRQTYQDMNYRDLDTSNKDDTSPPRKRSISAAE